MKTACIYSFVWFISLFGLFLFTPQISAQTHTISGVVTHQETAQPIRGVLVYLDRTTLVAETNHNGEFEISGIPDGHYVLVGYMIGFNVSTIDFDLPASFETISLTMEPNIVQLVDVISNEYNEDAWSQQVAIFRDIVMSTTPNSRKITILNPGDLEFLDERPILRAYAKRSIVFEHMDLGYDIEFVMKRFEYDRLNRLFKYEIYPLFIDIPASTNRMQRRIDANRNDLYYGSETHFLHLLATTDQTIERGRIGDFEIMVMSPLRVVSPEEYMYELSSGSRAWRRENIDLSRLFNTGPDGEKQLRRNVIFMRYLNKGEQVAYQELTRRSGAESMYQYSVLSVKEDVGISVNGVLHNPGSATMYGYLAWLRLADLLPLDFIPTE